MLSVFDQALIDPHCRQILHMEEDYPQEYESISRRLMTAIAEQEVRKRMNIEDEILSDLESRDRAVANWKQKEEKTRAELEKERKQKEEALKLGEEERRQKEEAFKKLEEAVKALVASGKSEGEARRLLNMSK